MPRIRQTPLTWREAVRKFSDLLNTIKFTGARYTIVRGGKPVATLGPAKVHSPDSTLGEFNESLAKLPHLGDEAMSFEKELKQVAKEQPKLPWQQQDRRDRAAKV